MRRLLIFSLLVLPANVVHAQRPVLTTEMLARELLGKLVAINTTLSEGATTPAAESLAVQFRATGFPATDVLVIGPNAKQKNLVVRWRGRNRALKPIVFNAHLDVVEAPKLEWSTHPFRLTEKDGYLYGRGVLDDKGPAAAIVAAWIAARRRGAVPDRDLVLALTAGEETDVGNGAKWLVGTRRALVDAEYVLNLDSGGADLSGDVVRAFALEAAEKVYLDLTMTARGAGGHSSVPQGDTPINQLARALTRVDAYRFPVTLNPVVRSFFEQRAMLGDEGSSAMAALAKEPNDLAAQSTLVKTPYFNAQLRTTCITTMLRAGTAPNAIPQEATATVNCRILPGESADSVIATLTREVADTSVVFSIFTPALVSGPSMPTPAILALIGRAVASVAPNTQVIPYMEVGGTDAGYFRNVGIPVYGVAGMFVPQSDIGRMHGRDERISLRAFREMVRYSEHLLAEVGSFPPPRGVRE